MCILFYVNHLYMLCYITTSIYAILYHNLYAMLYYNLYILCYITTSIYAMLYYNLFALLHINLYMCTINIVYQSNFVAVNTGL